MKHVESFHPSITLALHNLGLDSKAVLNAVNAWRGSVKADPSKTKSEGTTKISGQVTSKGKDNRQIKMVDKITEKSETEKGEVPMPGRLLAFSDALKSLDKFGNVLKVVGFEPELGEWLESTVSFRPVQGPVQAPKPETQAA